MKYKNNIIYKLVEYLSVIDHKIIQAEKIIYIIKNNNISEENFIKQIKWHNVIPQVYYNIEYLEKVFNINEIFFKNIKEKINKKYPFIIDKKYYFSSIYNTLEDISQVTTDIMIWKGGLCLMDLYLSCTNTYRQMDDIDIMISPKKFFCFINTILENGYNIDKDENLRLYLRESVIFKNNFNALKPISSFIYNLPFNPKRRDKRISIDVKSGNFSLFFPFDFFNNTIKLSFKDKEFMSVQWEYAIYIMLDHILRHGYIKFCWLNDLFLIISNFNLKWENIINTFAKKGWLNLFYSLLYRIDNNYKIKFSIEIPKNFTQEKSYKKYKIYNFLFNYRVNRWQIRKYFVYQDILRSKMQRPIVFHILNFYLIIKTMQDLIPKKPIIFYQAVNKFITILKIYFAQSIKIPVVYEVYPNQNKDFNNECSMLKIIWDRKLKKFIIKHPLFTFQSK